jgi:hypothetical protein
MGSKLQGIHPLRHAFLEAMFCPMSNKLKSLYEENKEYFQINLLTSKKMCLFLRFQILQHPTMSVSF